MSSGTGGKKPTSDLARLRAQVEGVVAGASAEDAPPAPRRPSAVPETPRRPAPVTARGVDADDSDDDVRMLPSDRGMVRGDRKSKISIELRYEDHFDFRMLAAKHGVSFTDAIGSLIRASVASDRVFTEEELLWLATQRRP